MTTSKEEEQHEQEDDLFQQSAEELAHIQSRIGPRFRRAEVRKRAGLCERAPGRGPWDSGGR
jgi:hypothetical protein